MSFLSVKNFIESGEKSLKDKNYWSALSVALMIPSICSRLAFAKDKDYTNQNGVPRDKKSYVDWCEHNMANEMWLKSCLGNRYADILYALRCDILHAGCINIYSDDKVIYLSLGNDCPTTFFTKYRIIDIPTLCQTIFRCATTWCLNFGANDFKHTYVFNTDNRDDRLLYQRLCEKERTDFLEEEFNKENERRKNDVKNNSTRHNNQ